MTPAEYGANMDRAGRHRRGGLYLESTEAEQLGVLPGQERRVGDMMDRLLVTIHPSSSLAQATAIMQQRRVASLIVGDESAPMGLLTERDLARQLACAESERAHTVGEAVAGRQTTACHEDDILADALAVMKERSLSALAVLDRRGLVVGILSPLLEAAAAVMPAVAPERTAKTQPDRSSPLEAAKGTATGIHEGPAKRRRRR